MAITNTIQHIGVYDTKIDLFEGQYAVPNGISYNSYAIIDEKIAIMDTVDIHFTQSWLEHLDRELGVRTPDYLIVHHMEPDHAANICNFMNRYPTATIVSSAKAFTMMKNFFGTDFADRRLIVKDGDTLPLGQHTLTFLAAPMVHWPEVMVSYDSFDRVLFSADGFGVFGMPQTQEDWADEARRYYIGIVGKYGAQVQALLKKASALDIRIICPLHGPVLTENLEYYLNLYDLWSRYQPQEEGIVIAYTSIYGNTKHAVLRLSEQLKAAGCLNVVLYDLARCDLSAAVADAFRYTKLVLATTTYNAGIFPYMREFIEHLTERNFSNHTVALIENGSWAPLAAKLMRSMLEPCKNLVYAEPTVKLLSALNEESEAQLQALAVELCPPST